ncbi:hypothetical protein [Elongatibacter sediminis]|uniref:SPOR domain-containing protein n=1 Tax=Elongatibacter sediminis TaxID=3119006 RepID=A0AAW9RAI4_9GAMM
MRSRRYFQRPGAWLRSLSLMVFWTATGMADYRAGIEAYRAGDFEGAHAEWHAVASQSSPQVEPGIRAEACYALAMLYWLGRGVIQDSVEAARWLGEAAELNHAGAQSKLGYLYLIGQGVPQDDFEAFKWLRMAAAASDADAQYNLGVMYRDGRGVPPEPGRALQWFSEAAANGDPVSAAIVEEYRRSGVLHTGIADTEERVPGSEIGNEAEEPSLVSQLARFGEDGQNEPDGEGADWPADVMRRDWIRSRDPAHYAIQVIAVRYTATVREFIQDHPDWQPFSVFALHSESGPVWVLLQGDYSSAEEAGLARERFPTTIQSQRELWIRPFGEIQAELEPRER